MATIRCTPLSSSMILLTYDIFYTHTHTPVQLYTYQKAFMTKFSMVSARLDIELLTSQQRMREAFSKEEVTRAKRLQSELSSFQEVSRAESISMHRGTSPCRALACSATVHSMSLWQHILSVHHIDNALIQSFHTILSL